jgi:hypothetical protein
MKFGGQVFGWGIAGIAGFCSAMSNKDIERLEMEQEGLEVEKWFEVKGFESSESLYTWISCVGAEVSLNRALTCLCDWASLQHGGFRACDISLNFSCD